jgi:hypothetical protein
MGYISREKLEEVAQSMRNSTYGDYLQRFLKEQFAPCRPSKSA